MDPVKQEKKRQQWNVRPFTCVGWPNDDLYTDGYVVTWHSEEATSTLSSLSTHFAVRVTIIIHVLPYATVCCRYVCRQWFWCYCIALCWPTSSSTLSELFEHYFSILVYKFFFVLCRKFSYSAIFSDCCSQCIDLVVVGWVRF